MIRTARLRLFVPALVTLLSGLPVLLPSGAALGQDSPVPASQEAGEAFALTHGPSLQLPTPTGVTVVWHTNRPGVSRVEYGTGGRLDHAAVTSTHGLIDNHRTSHVVRLEGLEPGTTYRYRVVSREFLGYERQHIVEWGDSVVSEVGTFTTFDPGKASYSFVMVSDLHQRAEELARMMALEPWEGIDFVVFNGDMINDFMEPDQIFDGFLDAAVEGFAGEIPFVFARGNHEVRGRYARSIPDVLATLGGRAYYAFDHGPAHVVVLDSGEDKEDGHEYYNGLVDFVRYREEQAQWLAADLQTGSARRAPWTIIISHIPPRTSDGFGALSVREHFEPLAHAGGADLWLSGHTHDLAHVAPLPGENGYTLLTAPPHAFTRVDVSAAEVRVRVFAAEGELLESFAVSR